MTQLGLTRSRRYVSFQEASLPDSMTEMRREAVTRRWPPSASAAAVPTRRETPHQRLQLHCRRLAPVEDCFDQIWCQQRQPKGWDINDRSSFLASASSEIVANCPDSNWCFHAKA